MNINIIGSETYIKDCPVENRWDLDISEDMAEKIATGIKKDYINIRCIQGTFIDHESGKVWLGDNLGRIAEGLSGGVIQLQPEESKKALTEGRSWTNIPTKDAKGWKEISVVYVYLTKQPSLQLSKQAENNPSRILYEAGEIFKGQYVGLTNDLTLIVGDHQEEVIKCIQGEEVKKL